MTERKVSVNDADRHGAGSAEVMSNIATLREK
jgi:hypothetical protein